MKFEDLVLLTKPTESPKKDNSRKYDVKVSCIGGGNDGKGRKKANVVRIGLINKAGEEFSNYSKVCIALVDGSANRMYIIGSNDESDKRFYTLHHSKNNRNSSSYSFTPRGREEKILRTKWIGEYKACFDEECGLFYITPESKVIRTEVNNA